LGPTANQFTNGTLDAPPNNNSYNDTNGSRHSELSLCTKYQLCTLGRCLHAHSLGDFCIIGPKGVGKSFLSKAFAELAGYSRDYTTLICLYKDMTTRDLFEGRRTKANGDTYWELSPLLMLALKGGLAILDGVEQIHPATLASLQRLVNDREVSLASGKRFMSVNRCAKLLARLKSDANVKPSEKNLNWLKINHNVYAIHSSFRIVALARPPLGNRGLERGSWMTAENCTIFPFVWVRPLLFKEESRVIKSRAPNVSDEDVATLVQLAQTARSPENEGDEIISSIAESLSTRQLIRLCKQREATNNANSATISLYRGVQRLCLSRFMPSVVRATLEQLLQDHNITSTSDLSSSGDDLNKDGGMIIRTVVNSEGDDFLHIGPVRKKLDKVSKAPLLVPHLLFYENPRQTKTLMDMLNDFNVGEHLLLIGNQGVGKNKLADYFLKLMRLPREYIQLHRDTTVSQLTTQPSVVDGQLLFADSPLVRAAKEGYVLVVDEADKAPTHVTALLKGLAEDREMMLGDGRRIREMPEEESNSGTTKDVRLHPDFRMIVLANRPGYPFLGNDFFKVVGSVFSTFAIDNPDGASELNLLRNYAGGVPDAVLRKLVAAFTELRQYTEEGTLSYPYSTRELVNAVRHLDKFPKDGISSVLRNIFDFDKFSNEERDILVNAFRRQGIVLDTESNMEITLGVVSVLPEPIHTETWLVGDIRSSDQSSSSKNNSVVTLVTQNIELNHEASELGGMGMGALIVDQFSRYDLRADSFGEAEYRFQVTGRGNIAGTCVLESGRIFVVRHHIGEVDLQLVDLTTDTTRTIQSSFSCPPMKGRGIFRPMPPKITVLPLTGERVLIHNPREHGVSVVDAHTGQCRHYVIPFSKGGIVPTGQRNQPSSYSRVLISGSLNEELFAVYCSGRTELFFVHVDDGTSRFDKNQGDRLFSIQVPFPIFSIKAVSRELWLIQSGTKGSTYHVLQFGPRVLRTRLCSIKRDPTSMEDGLISQLRWLSTSANRIDGSRSVPSGMNDRLFRHLHSNGTYGQLVPGLGAALGAMRGGRVPIFTYLREDYQHKNNSSSSSKNSSTPSTSRPVPSSIVFLKHSRQLVTCTEMNGGTNASVEVVSVREGVVRRVIVPINEPLPETVPGASGSGSNPLDDSRSQNLGFSKFTDNGWKSLTSKPSRATFVNELKDGRLLFNDFCGNYYVLEVRTEEIMGSLEDWANMVGSGRGAEGDIGNLDVGMIVDGEEVGVGSGDGDENGDGDGDGKGDGDGDGEGNGEGNGKGKGKGDGEGQGEGNGKGGGSNTGQRKGNLGANGDLPDPMLEYEMMQQEVQDNLDKERKSGRNEDGMTPEVEAQVKAAKAEAWRRLLEKIDMDEADLLKYEAYRKRVVTEIRQLRVVLESLEARKNERTWLRNKDAGDLDDRRLIDGLTGSRNIYKARGEQPPDMGSFQELPKRIHFLFDLSMSMSRYAMDGRLQRSLEAATMVMESFRGFDHKYKYKIGGHSGDSEKLVFVEEGKPPANDRERLQVIRKMHAHSDLCDSGDNTLTSVRYAVREIVKQDADEHAVFLLSDANLVRSFNI
jgi:MoxR-like ATPase